MEQPRGMKVLALHLTKPSNSEANVVANLLKNLGGDIEVKLLVNQRGASDRDSFFTPLVAVPGFRCAPSTPGSPSIPKRRGPSYDGSRRALTICFAGSRCFASLTAFVPTSSTPANSASIAAWAR